MKKLLHGLLCLSAAMLSITGCSKDDSPTPTPDPIVDPGSVQPYAAIKAAFGSNIDPLNLINYASQSVPAYVTKDMAPGRTIDNAKATVGRVLFYDKSLSINNTVSCGSCHQQRFAFGDTALASNGVEGGLTGRHSMRIINTRFAEETKFFWDERAASLPVQTTMPVQDHFEMGYSGQNGRQNMADMIAKLQGIGYYKELFRFVYNDSTVTEARVQDCLAQFIWSIQSFDAKYDAGRAQVANNNLPFPNFSQQENQGKNLFQAPPQFDATGSRTGGGLGCGGCHRAPEFDIDPASGNNNIVGRLNATGIDVNNTRAPSLRDLADPAGNPNGPMMHTGVITSLQAAIGHYGTISRAPGNNRLDPRLAPPGSQGGQRLNLTATEVNAVIAFLKTLSGSNVYTDPRWSNPFK